MKRRQAVLALSGLACLFVFCAGTPMAESFSWSQVAEEIVAQINMAESLYQEGKPTEAGQAVTLAYFGIFEDRKMEAAIRIELGAKHAYEVEQQFGALRRAIRTQADKQAVHGLARELREAVRRDAEVLDQANIPMEVFQVKQ